VRFTALGSAGDKPVGVVVGTIVCYLIAPDRQSEASTGASPERPTGDGSVSRYYADRGDSPGRWLGQGARELRLRGTVDLDEFTTVLAGRDPRIGARLISARGSSGRVTSVGAGTAARWSLAGEALYSVRDAAAVLGWSQADVRQAIDEGEHLAASRLIETLTGTPIPAGTRTPGTSGAGPGRHPGRDREAGSELPRTGNDPGADREGAGTALVPFIDADGTRYFTDRELSRVEELAARGVTANQVLAAGDPGDELSSATPAASAAPPPASPWTTRPLPTRSSGATSPAASRRPQHDRRPRPHRPRRPRRNEPTGAHRHPTATPATDSGAGDASR
jgi:TrwC relaxase